MLRRGNIVTIVSIPELTFVGASAEEASVGGSFVGGVSVGKSFVGGTSVGGISVVEAFVVGASVGGVSVVEAFVGGASVVGASVVGASVVGASVVGASVVGASVGGILYVGQNYVCLNHGFIWEGDETKLSNSWVRRNQCLPLPKGHFLPYPELTTLKWNCCQWKYI